VRRYLAGSIFFNPQGRQRSMNCTARILKVNVELAANLAISVVGDT
jgi:hypothetical protein